MKVEILYFTFTFKALDIMRGKFNGHLLRNNEFVKTVLKVKNDKEVNTDDLGIKLWYLFKNIIQIDNNNNIQRS